MGGRDALQRSLHRCGILQIRSNRRDAGSGCRLARQAEDLPSLTDEVRGKIASDDAGGTDDEGGPWPGSWLRLLRLGGHTGKMPGCVVRIHAAQMGLFVT